MKFTNESCLHQRNEFPIGKILHSSLMFHVNGNDVQLQDVSVASQKRSQVWLSSSKIPVNKLLDVPTSISLHPSTYLRSRRGHQIQRQKILLQNFVVHGMDHLFASRLGPSVQHSHRSLLVDGHVLDFKKRFEVELIYGFGNPDDTSRIQVER